MRLHRRELDHETLADRRVRQPFEDEFENLLLALGEGLEGEERRRLQMRGRGASEVERRPAGPRLAQGLEHDVD
ncbi:hypothetical protein D9V41_07215 [Aeromicrobium phragmitis]|uniref:Uncharacterized protein n=1 Tax=Aeromicrobium phragmitis TaxID=2478914 RepID=A0A3L8PP50_9ACTN|nr:hypothetical protein D9V41_07215 [Aeromicrobium phragmitis]